jgi:hypothetical protein
MIAIAFLYSDLFLAVVVAFFSAWHAFLKVSELDSNGAS